MSDPLGGEAEVAEVALTRYVVSAIELVDVDDLSEFEPTPVRHLSVVGGSFDDLDLLPEEQAG